MSEKTRPDLPQDPGWILEQIEMGFRQLEPRFEKPPELPKMSQEEIESAVTRALQEELDRLDEEEKSRKR